ncbi:hypothetical protein R1sor_015080 [Riccia sorocarpa]|uniref:Fe2OG dioxygenase domain-containing protein n=1 Tax=Riccia sorocarpa TaxID=122646 RepID=A0ABD3HD27_9MARC
MLKARSVLSGIKRRAQVGNLKMTMAKISFSSIPVIDISPLLESRSTPKVQENSNTRRVINEIDQACRNVGFFYVQGHGVPLDMMNQVRQLAHEFFTLSTDEKYKIKMSSASGWRGYQRVGENVTKGVSDMHEAIDFLQDYDGGDFPAFLHDHPLHGRNLWPETPTSFRPVCKEYLSAVQEAYCGKSCILAGGISLDLGKRIMQAISLALTGVHDSFEGSRAGSPFWLFRVIGYPPLERKITEVGCGEHTDYGLLTLVNQDEGIRALQVKNQAGEWIWADPVPGTFVVNIGDMLKIWSNGLYMPTVHRVLNDNSKYRVSVPYFYEPNFDALVKPLDSCKQVTGGESKFASVVYGEHLTKKVLNNFK